MRIAILFNLRITRFIPFFLIHPRRENARSSECVTEKEDPNKCAAPLLFSKSIFFGKMQKALGLVDANDVD